MKQRESSSKNNLLPTLKKRISKLLDFLLVVLKLVRVKPNAIWVGDSHAHFISRNGKRIRHFSITDENHLLIWLGPKLLYSVSKHGLSIDKLTKLVLNKAAFGQNLVLSFGEIDCRVHFVTKTLDKGVKGFDNIAKNYSDSVMEFLKIYNLGSALILTPVPPSDFGLDNPVFPRNGSLSERVIVTKMITESLVNISSPKFRIINLFGILSNQDGTLNMKYSSDGVHVNFLGSNRILKELGFQKYGGLP